MNWSTLSVFLSVLAIDVTLALDNAVVIGSVAARLPASQQRKALLIGIFAALIFRIFFASIAIKLLAIAGLTFAGGILLLWVAWKLWRELRKPTKSQPNEFQVHKLWPAVFQILIADISMSLDNTLAVTGAARDHFWILVFGLLASVGLTGLASSFLVKLSQRFTWISYIGLAIVGYVAISMIIDGAHELKFV